MCIWAAMLPWDGKLAPLSALRTCHKSTGRWLWRRISLQPEPRSSNPPKGLQNGPERSEKLESRHLETPLDDVWRLSSSQDKGNGALEPTHRKPEES